MIQKELWHWLYGYCYRDSGTCYPRDDGTELTRSDAFTEVGGLGYYSLAFPDEGTGLVRYVNENINSSMHSFDAALDVGLSEQQFRDIMELNTDELGMSDCSYGDFYAQAAKVGWLKDVPDWCVASFIEAYRFKDAITFLAGAGREDLRPSVHQALTNEAYRHGEYRVMGGLPVVDVKVGNYEEWGGS